MPRLVSSVTKLVCFSFKEDGKGTYTENNKNQNCTNCNSNNALKPKTENDSTIPRLKVK